MCILFLRISGPRDFVKHISGKLSLRWKELIAQKLLLRGKIKKVLSRAHVRSLEQRAWNTHDQSEQTLVLNTFKEAEKWWISLICDNQVGFSAG